MITATSASVKLTYQTRRKTYQLNATAYPAIITPPTLTLHKNRYPEEHPKNSLIPQENTSKDRYPQKGLWCRKTTWMDYHLFCCMRRFLQRCTLHAFITCSDCLGSRWPKQAPARSMLQKQTKDNLISGESYKEKRLIPQDTSLRRKTWPLRKVPIPTAREPPITQSTNQEATNVKETGKLR